MKSITLTKRALVIAMAIGALSTGFTAAEAMPPIQIPQIQSNSGDLVMAQFVQNNNMRGRMDWQMQRDGNRCRTRFGNCQHYHQGYYYQTPWWTLPLIIGSVAASNGGSSHIQWCRSHYRSYNAQTDMWLGNSASTINAIVLTDRVNWSA